MSHMAVESDYVPVHKVLVMEDIEAEAEQPWPSSSHIPLVLTFTNLTYHIRVGRKFPMARRFHDDQYDGSAAARSSIRPCLTPNTKVLLNDISGEAVNGEILAVLGASGSGKTTFLDAVANKIAKASLKGTVTLNGEVLGPPQLKAISAYVMQDDILYPMLTVEETLMFAAQLKLEPTLSKLEKRQRVEGLIHQLGLEDAAKTVVGDEGHRGISGGEKRRVSIGVEVISKPMVLFLDEPTSGLDSSSAYEVMKLLQEIARNGSIIITSIHQPSYRILTLLDRVLLLSRGDAVYCGSSVSLPSFLDHFGYPIPENENWAEFILDLTKKLERSPNDIKALIEFNKLSLSTEPFKKDHPQNPRLATQTSFMNPFWMEIAVLSRRSFTNSLRMPEIFLSHLGVVVFTGLVLGSVFRHLDDSPKGIMNRLGLFLYILCTICYSCAVALPVFLQDRSIFLRETANNTYRRLSYVVSHAFVAVPSLVIISLAFAVVTFWTVGLAGGVSGFCFYALTLFATFWAGISFVTFLSGVVPNVIAAFTLITGILSFLLLFSGFFLPRDQIPSYWIWFPYVSFVKYPYQAMLQNEFQDPNKCFSRGVQFLDNVPLGVVLKEKVLQCLSSSAGTDITTNTCLTRGADVLQQQGITDLSKWNSILITLAYGFSFRFLFYISLLYGSKNKRK